MLFRSNIAQSSNECLALPNALEIYRTLLFHMTETLTPKALRSCGNSVLTVILGILLPFVLALELKRIGLPTVLVEALPIGILHELLDLLGDVGLHKSSSSEDSFVSLLLAFKALLLLFPDIPILVNPSS